MAVVVTREQYFETAMTILAEDGHGALKIGALCRRLGVTTGSFYHYFGSLDGFVDALLEHWEQEQTARIITLVAQATDPVQRVKKMKKLALTVPHEAEGAIRAWANSNAAVAVAQKRVDVERQNALRDIILGIVPNKRRAELLAVMGITLLVGLQQWRTPVDLNELGKIFDEYEDVIYRHAKGS